MAPALYLSLEAKILFFIFNTIVLLGLNDIGRGMVY